MKFRIISYALFFILLVTPLLAQNVAVGFKAPDFSLEYVGGKGKQVSSEEFLNKKVVIVHFWKFN